MQITIYTDGACDVHAENRPGGWAAILQAVGEDGQIVKERVISGGAERTTNNVMELTAVIEGLKLLKRVTGLSIVSDSRYVIDIASGAKKAAKNKTLWSDFFQVADGHFIEWRYVAGHAGDELNERCDRLAVAEKNKRARPKNRPADEPIVLQAGMAGIFLATRHAAKDKATSWAAVIVLDDMEREVSGRLEKTSELEGTLIGAIKSLESRPEAEDAILFTAQEYLAKGMNQWLHGWMAKGWKTRGGESVKYRRHWERLNELAKGRKVSFRFVKTRDGIPQFQRGKELTAEILRRA
ncbi:MAG: hypothetical protein OXN88_08910 [Chloroflexota bacterium]|nr:hypothetical protein [Chloroflexota bacterium]